MKGGKRPKFFVAEDCHPQTIALVETRGGAINLDIVVSVVYLDRIFLLELAVVIKQI